MTIVWAVLLLLCNLLAWASNFFTIPGNWLVLMFSLVYYVVLPADASVKLTTLSLVIIAVLAVLGEAWEFMAGAAGAAKQGGTWRGVALAVVGSLAGSIAGAMGLSFLPVVGPLVGALGGGAAGAFLGAYFGERNRSHEERMAIGKGAFWGRLFGTAGKIVFGLIMVILITVDSFS